ncbi:MAG TPA: MFS transporter [Chloroflexota bacterium]|nr:MFS transporter [Chloroflexota bacterium]
MTASSNPAPLWRNRNFVPLWSGLLVSNLGDWINYVAMYAFVYQQTHSALALVGLRLIHIIPELVLGPFVGVFVDRWSRKKTLVVAPLVVALFVGSLVFVHPIALIFVAEAAITIGDMFFDPAVSAAMPSIVAGEHLVQANTLTRITSTVSTLFGGLAGGVLVAAFGAPFAFGIDAISYLAIAGMVTTVRVKEVRVTASIASIEHELLEGVRYLRTHPLVTNVVTAGALFIFAPASMFTLGIVFAQSVLHAGTTGYGILLGGLGAGSLVGAVVMIAIRNRVREDLAFAVTGIALGAAIALLGLSRSLPLAVAAYGVAGGMTMINGVSAVTLIQRLVPDQLRGRIFAVASSFDHLGAFASTLLIAAGAGVLGVAGLVTISGAIAAVAGLWVLGVAIRVRERHHP